MLEDVILAGGKGWTGCAFDFVAGNVCSLDTEQSPLMSIVS